MTLDKLRGLCLSFPGVTEDIKWGHDICFSVGQKMFCVTSEEGGASFKVSDEEFEVLTGRNGIVPAPYLARNKWVFVREFSSLKYKEWEHFIAQSYSLVRSRLPRKMQQEL